MLRFLLSRSFVFLALIIGAAVCAFVGHRLEPDFLHDLWSQLLWLFVNILATTFVLERILQRGESIRRQREDRFAFQTFAASALNSMLEVGQVEEPTGWKARIPSGASSKAEFAKSVEAACASLSSIRDVNPEIYETRIEEIRDMLQTIAKSYIRLYSTSRTEMVETFWRMQELIRGWRYRNSLSTAFIADTATSEMSDELRRARVAETKRQNANVQLLVVDTAIELSALARRATRTKNMYID